MVCDSEPLTPLAEANLAWPKVAHSPPHPNSWFRLSSRSGAWGKLVGLLSRSLTAAWNAGTCRGKAAWRWEGLGQPEGGWRSGLAPTRASSPSCSSDCWAPAFSSCIPPLNPSPWVTGQSGHRHQLRCYHANPKGFPSLHEVHVLSGGPD